MKENNRKWNIFQVIYFNVWSLRFKIFHSTREKNTADFNRPDIIPRDILLTYRLKTWSLNFIMGNMSEGGGWCPGSSTNARAKSVQPDHQGYTLWPTCPLTFSLFESKPKGSGGYPARAFPGSTTLNVWWWAHNLEIPKTLLYQYSNCHAPL